MALFEEGRKFAVHISQLQTKISKNEIYQYIQRILLDVLIYFSFFRNIFLTEKMVP